MLRQIKDEQEEQEESCFQLEESCQLNEMQVPEEYSQTGIDPQINRISTRIAGIQGEIAKVQREINWLVESRRDEEVILSEKYKKEGLQYFENHDYANAVYAFDLALRYQQHNTTLLFYHSYSLWRRHYINRKPLSSRELENVIKQNAALQNAVFNEEEWSGFSVEKMHEIVGIMAASFIEIKRQREDAPVHEQDFYDETTPLEGNMREHQEAEQEL